VPLDFPIRMKQDTPRNGEEAFFCFSVRNLQVVLFLSKTASDQLASPPTAASRISLASFSMYTATLLIDLPLPQCLLSFDDFSFFLPSPFFFQTLRLQDILFNQRSPFFLGAFPSSLRRLFWFAFLPMDREAPLSSISLFLPSFLLCTKRHPQIR